MKKNTRLRKTICLAAACLTLAASFTGCDLDTENVSSSDILTEDTSIPAETSSLPDSNSALPESFEFNGIHSYLVINNYRFPHYSVEDGYYTIHFLADNDFQDKVNNDIKEAMQKISLSYNKDYLAEKDGPLYPHDWSAIVNSVYNADEMEMANGIAIELICQNGYLSIALGYLDSDGYSESAKTQLKDEFYPERYWDIVETLNYDIINNKKIENFSELLCDGADASAVLNNAVLYYNNDKFITPDTDPEHFTIYYTLQDNHGEYSNNYSTLQYFSCEAEADYKNLSLLKTACYRDMSSKIEKSIASGQLFDEWTPDAYKVVDEDGIYYARLKASVDMTADEINEYNSKIAVIQHKAVDKYGHCFKDVGIIPEGASFPKTMKFSAQASMSETLNNICVVSNLYQDGNKYYDIDTAEEITIEALLGPDWKDYLDYGKSSSNTGSCILDYCIFEPKDNTFEICCYDNDKELYFIVPADKINPRYAIINN